MSRKDFGELLLLSVYDMYSFNRGVEKLGITVKPCVEYEYYFGDKFLCTSEDLCVDDLIEAAGFEVCDHEQRIFPE